MGLVDGKSGIVTGAAGGIGRASAVVFGTEGANVVVTDLPALEEQGIETVRQIEQAGGRAVWVPGDVSQAETHERLIGECVATFGRLDYAFNNAGIEHYADFVETTEEDFTRVFEVDQKGVFLGLKAQMIQMREQGGGGSIINTSSLAGVLAVPQISAYIAAKHAVVGLTKSAAIEGGRANIRVNCILPTAIRTEMIARLDQEIQDWLLVPHAIKRLGEPSEIGEAAVWLASDRSSIITGVALPCDLGTTAGFPGE